MEKTDTEYNNNIMTEYDFDPAGVGNMGWGVRGLPPSPLYETLMT
jgi:hypothetical protein